MQRERYLAEGCCVAGEAADHGGRCRHVPAGDHQAPGHSWEELISSLGFHKTLEPHHARSFLPEHRSKPLQEQKEATSDPIFVYTREWTDKTALSDWDEAKSSDHETIEDDVGGASRWPACRCGGEGEGGRKGRRRRWRREDWRRKTSGEGRGKGGGCAY